MNIMIDRNTHLNLAFNKIIFAAASYISKVNEHRYFKIF